MTPEMTKAELLATMRSERAAWDALLDRVDPRLAVQPGAAGTWSLRDVIAHVTAYERLLVEALEQIAGGGTYKASSIRQLPLEERNARLHAASIGLSLYEARAEAGRVFTRLLGAIDRYSEEDLRDATRFGGLVVNEPAWKAFAGESYEHYHEHIPGIRAWLASTGGSDDGQGTSSCGVDS
jgi:hypothetical protein